jgi:hypothetical protein
MRLVVGGEVIVMIDGHSFQMIGAGWTKAGDLASGDEILTCSGRARIDANEHQGNASVWNLRLAGNDSYLVGRLEAVVDDGSPVDDRRRTRETGSR